MDERFLPPEDQKTLEYQVGFLMDLPMRRLPESLEELYLSGHLPRVTMRVSAPTYGHPRSQLLGRTVRGHVAPDLHQDSDEAAANRAAKRSSAAHLPDQAVTAGPALGSAIWSTRTNLTHVMANLGVTAEALRGPMPGADPEGLLALPD